MTVPRIVARWLAYSAAHLMIPCCVAQDIPALPYSGTDTIVYVDDNGRQKKQNGSIEDLRGDRLVFRPNGSGPIQRIDTARLSQLIFLRGEYWDAALQLHSKGEPASALGAILKAIESETRPWAWAEGMAFAARLEIQLGQRVQAVSRIELIRARDLRTRHVGLLPLVWDERLPEAERLQLPVIRMASDSPVIRIAAASSWLHDPQNRAGATRALNEVAKAEGASLLGQLARAQLWRLHLLEKPAERNPVLKIWRETILEIPPGARGGPQFVLAANLEAAHDYDRAALGYLWTPMMTPWDPALSAHSIQRAVVCLRKAGRPAEAGLMLAELKQRFPESSVAQTLEDELKQ